MGKFQLFVWGFSFLSGLIGLAGIPDDLKLWHRCLSMLDHDVARWVFTVLCALGFWVTWKWDWIKIRLARAKQEAMTQENEHQQQISREPYEAAAEKSQKAPPPATTAPASKAGEWISENEALKLIRNSSLTQLRLPNETITVGEAIARRMGFENSPTASDIRANEIASYLLQKYNDQGTWTNRNDRYYKQYLEEWINEEVFRDYEATRSR